MTLYYFIAVGCVWGWVIYMIAWICSPLIAWAYQRVLWRGYAKKCK